MILDFIIIFLLLISAIIGYKIGLVNYILNLASMFTGLIISLLFSNKFSDFLITTPIKDFVYNIIHNKILELNITDTASVTDVLLQLDLSDFTIELLEGILNSLGFATDTAFNLSENLTSVAISIISFFTLWFGLSILIAILKMILNTLRAFKPIKFIDGIFGIIFSTVLFFSLICLVIAGVNYINNFDFINQYTGNFLIEQYNTSFGIYKYFEDENLILKILNAITNN